MSAISPEMQAEIAVWRQKALDGTLTLEEIKRGITLLRGDRVAARQSSTTGTRARAKTAIKAADDLINELKGL